MSSLDITITCFSTSIENNIPLAYPLMNQFIQNHVVVDLIGQENVSSEFTYQIKLGHTAHLKLFFVCNLGDKNPMAPYSDIFLLFVNIENKEDCDKITEIVDFINNLGVLDKNVFVLGVYKEKEKKTFGKQEIEEKFVNCSLEHRYTEIEENTLSKALEGLFITIYDSLQSTMKKEKLDGDKGRSRCIIF